MRAPAPRTLQRSFLSIVLFVAAAALAQVAAPPLAHADAALDLVRSVAGAPSEGAACSPRRSRVRTASRRTRRPAVHKHHRRTRPARARRSPHAALTAAQRGSGQVDTIDAMDMNAPVSLGEGPAIEAKGQLEVGGRVRK
jgi:hypothetical protein